MSSKQKKSDKEHDNGKKDKKKKKKDSDISEVERIYKQESKEVKLTKEQELYIKHANNECTKLIACPGSGKTLCIIERQKFIINNKKCEKKDVFVMTFTRFSKDDFIERMRKING